MLAAEIAIAVLAGPAIAAGQGHAGAGTDVHRGSAEGAERYGSLSGIVVSPSGRGLGGALVRIEGSEQRATTDVHGRFHFPGLPPGAYRLNISYLGSAGGTRTILIGPGSTAEQRFEIGQRSPEDAEIVVYGWRSARARALNLQRAAENSSDVLSSDDLGDFAGTTFAEALRRAPGVAFQRDPLTGDGTNIIVRGLEPDMNAVKLNGLTLPVGNGTGRSADLGNLLADTVSRITVHKSLLPRQDSAGTGGLVEIETLSPLERPRRYAAVQVEGGRSGKAFADDLFLSGTVSARIGAEDNLGLSASLQYREQSFRTISYSLLLNYGRFLPPDEQGLPTLTSLQSIHPLLTFPFLPEAAEAYPSRLETGFNKVEQSTFAAGIDAEWQIADHSNLRLSGLRSETRRTSFTLTDAFSVLSNYAERPGGETLAELRLDLAPGNRSLRRQQVYTFDPDVRIRTDTVSLNARTHIGRLTMTAVLGYARGKERHPAQLGLQLRMPDSDARADYFLGEATDPATGHIVSPFAPRSGRGLPLPLFKDSGWAFINDPASFSIGNGGGGVDAVKGSNDRATASFSARFDLPKGPLRYLEAGVHFERSSFRSDLVRTQFGGDVSAADLGLAFGPSDLGRIGIGGTGFTIADEAAVAGFAGRIAELTQTTGLTFTPVVRHPDQDEQFTRETHLAGYIQAQLQFGRFELVGGARVNRTRLAARNLIFPTYIGPILPENGGGFGLDLVFQNAFTQLVEQKETATDILPRVLLNYRYSDDLIVRGGYFLSVARPQIAQLSSQTRLSFINIPLPGPAGIKPILEIVTGNPDLKPATTHNFDLGIEHYSNRVGILKLSAFYKSIRNLLQSNISAGTADLAAVVLPDHPYFQGPPFFDPANPEAVFITGRTPANSEHSASIWGIEAQLERRFTFLPGAWSGLGVYANYTFTKSKRTERYVWAGGAPGENIFEFRSIPFVQQPRHSGTLALTYNRYGIDANLAYSFQSRTLGRFEPRGLSLFNEGVRTLDLRFEYSFERRFGRLRAYFEASDLLKRNSDPDIMESFGGEGDTPRFYTRATYLGGRRFKAGLALTF